MDELTCIYHMYFRLCLQEDVREASAEQGEISSRTIKALRELFKPVASNNENIEKERKTRDGYEDAPTRTRYNLISTIYFHLLTGPLGSNVRALGDVLAWVATTITKRVRGFLDWRKRAWKSWKRKHAEKKEQLKHVQSN